jgi:hypothetical protein
MSAIYNEKNPLVFTQHTPLKAQYFENGKAMGAVFTTEILTK